MSTLIDFLLNVDAHWLASQTNRPLYVPGTGRKVFSAFYAPVVESKFIFCSEGWWFIYTKFSYFVEYLPLDAFLEESPMQILESDEFVNDIDVMFSVALGVSN